MNDELFEAALESHPGNHEALASAGGRTADEAEAWLHAQPRSRLRLQDEDGTWRDAYGVKLPDPTYDEDGFPSWDCD